MPATRAFSQVASHNPKVADRVHTCGAGDVVMVKQAGHRALRRGRVSQDGQIYIVTTTTLRRQRWLEGFDAAVAACRCFEAPSLLNGNRMLAWVLMPDHVHWLIQLDVSGDLARTVNRLKSASARSANRALGRRGTMWATAFHDRALRVDDDVVAAARYIVANPIRAGLVSQVGDYPFWNAAWM